MNINQKPTGAMVWQLVRALQDKIIRESATAEKGTFMLTRHIMDEFSVSHMTVQRAVGHLVDLEVLSYESGYGYKLHPRAKEAILFHRANPRRPLHQAPLENPLSVPTLRTTKLIPKKLLQT